MWKIEENLRVLELNGTHQLLVYGVNFFQRSATKIDKFLISIK
jgi:hypothetical protein